MDSITQRVCLLLHCFGVTANYKGFYYTAHALELCAMQPERLALITKLVYMDVAKLYHTNWKAVERDIRTVGQVMWQRNRDMLERLAGISLTEKPCNAQLLAILSTDLISLDISALAAYGLDEQIATSRKDYSVRRLDPRVDECGGKLAAMKNEVPLAALQVNNHRTASSGASAQ